MECNQNKSAVEGAFIELNGEQYYQIRNMDQMPAFFISLVSSSDHWFYISSRGSLSAGRIRPELALFPYKSDDYIHESAENTGSKTLVRISNEQGMSYWEPFNTQHDYRYKVERNIYKNATGNKLIFEEINHDLGLAFHYEWSTSDRFGFVRTSTISLLSTAAHDAAKPLQVEVIDGLQNLLPAGTPAQLQNLSALCDAYKWNEQVGPSGLTSFSMYAQLSDRAEPAESLRCTSAYYLGAQPEAVLVSSEQIHQFRHGGTIQNEVLKRGVRCAYLLYFKFELQVEQPHSWTIVTDIEQTQVQLAATAVQLKNPAETLALITEAVTKDGEELRKLMAASDALQHTAEQTTSVHHYANVLFNNMRGGAIVNNYQISADDYQKAVKQLNATVHESHQAFFNDLPTELSYQQLMAQVAELADPQLLRLTMEYLPITFGRRHGDPSRPWNHFEIKVKDGQGDRLLNYQGNWRDIFQNWEALALSFPDFIPSFIAKFVNASTVDGYNPYRITKQGIDWEVVEEDNPWSNIGYWGDHQIIYLLKFLEWSKAYQPSQLQHMLHQPLYAYAQVPYKIKPYQQMLQDAKDTVVFDHALAAEISKRVAQFGSDGKLVPDNQGQVYLCSLMEKLLVPYLSKLGNFVAEGGIWLNTQRPEWNDANNAIVGNGLSMVTLYYMKRYVDFLQTLLSNEQQDFVLSREVADWLLQTCNALEQFSADSMDAHTRKQLLNALGQVADDYRHQVYQHGFSGTVTVEIAVLRKFLAVTQTWLAQSIKANKRDDGLYEAYNIGVHQGESLQVEQLAAMLEGQVAVLSSGELDAKAALVLLEQLYASGMYRADQHTFTLYPDRDLPGFMAKNRISVGQVSGNTWLSMMLERGDTRVISRDASGEYRFNADFANNKPLASVLHNMLADYPQLDNPADNMQQILDIYEAVFNHKAFTGRSGTMFAYEGLGSIYWHMVSKLLLAVQEIYLNGLDNGTDKPTLARLAHYYYRVREGIGFNKTPENYGAVPCDPYSHTPSHGGARQPGMTGQVKEEVITRWGELGLQVKDGQLHIKPTLLREREFITHSSAFHYYDLAANAAVLPMEANSLAFTWCGVPFIYQLSDTAEPVVTVFDLQGEKVMPMSALDIATSQALFARNGQIQRIELRLPRQNLLVE
ncbi:MAG: hypothetical protein ACRC3K_01835 [Plesiomonas sp.]